MIPLQTIVPNPATSLRLRHDRPVMLIGSCFTEHMARHLGQCGFSVMSNPFGILYNPISIAQCLERCLNGTPICDDDLVFYDGLWHSWLHHGSFSHPDKDECLRRCNELILQAHDFLARRPVVITTLGTAYIYEYGARVVANCHKLPSDQFAKRLLAIDEVVRAFAPIKTLDLLFTISPIRHWADTPHGNQLSKSTLLLAVDRLLSQLSPLSDYFPAYEIMMDELRDYRFYESDMLHPSSVAVEVIWEHFIQTYFDADTHQLAQKYIRLDKMESHRPQRPDSPAYQQHLAKIQALRTELQKMTTNTTQKS